MSREVLKKNRWVPNEMQAAVLAMDSALIPCLRPSQLFLKLIIRKKYNKILI